MIFRFHVKFPGCMPNDFDSLSLDHGKYQEYAVMAALRQVNRLWQKSNLRVGQESSFFFGYQEKNKKHIHETHLKINMGP